MDHWAVTTSSGRRVSLLCDDQSDYAMSHYAPSNSPTPPPSPDYSRPYAPIRTDSISSACSSTSSLSTVSSQGYTSPKTPPNVALPSLEKLLPVPEASFFPGKYNPEIKSPVIAPVLLAQDGSMSPASSQSPNGSSPSSPKSAPANPAVKRSSRRYTCHCGKSFTTSGHLARHTRIHTGEKNYVCPEAGCGARFSRQDNCMQHYRTHQSGTGSKRAARKRRMSTDSVPSQQSSGVDTPPTERSHSYSGPTSYPYGSGLSDPYGADSGGLAALATVACSAHT